MSMNESLSNALRRTSQLMFAGYGWKSTTLCLVAFCGISYDLYSYAQQVELSVIDGLIEATRTRWIELPYALISITIPSALLLLLIGSLRSLHISQETGSLKERLRIVQPSASHGNAGHQMFFWMVVLTASVHVLAGPWLVTNAGYQFAENRSSYLFAPVAHPPLAWIASLTVKWIIAGCTAVAALFFAPLKEYIFDRPEPREESPIDSERLKVNAGEVPTHPSVGKVGSSRSK